MVWRCRHYTLQTTAPLIMGVVNLHPASFASISYRNSIQETIEQVTAMVEQGAAIIDLGAEPTNPQRIAGTTSIDAKEELTRLLPVLKELTRIIQVPISIDTSQPEVMRAAYNEGASIVNDVRALAYEGALEAVATSDMGVCLMHQGSGKDIMAIKQFLVDKAQHCEQAGIAHNRIVLDPGIGNGSFGKTSEENLRLLQRLNRMTDCDYPILVGVSRKTFIGDVLQVPETDRLAGSLAALVVAYQQGARILRVHDVKESMQALKIIQAIGTL